MQSNSLPRFRRDLSITLSKDPETQVKVYRVCEPRSGETFEFGEQQFFLCQALDGVSSPEEILAQFSHHFGFAISNRDLEDFLGQLQDLSLLDPGSRGYVGGEEEDDDDEDDLGIDPRTTAKSRWSWVKLVAPVINFLAILIKPFEVFFQLLVWAMLPLAAISGWVWLNNQILIQQNLDSARNLISFLVNVLIFLFTINFFTKIFKGVIGKVYGGNVKDFGLQLRWGFVPRFYVKIGSVNRFNRKQQLWFQGSPLILRLMLLIVGTFVWYANSGRGNTLSNWGIFFAEMGLLTFLHGLLPLRLGSPGAKLLCLSFNKGANYPRQLVKRALQHITSIFSRTAKKEFFLSGQDVLILSVGLVLLALFSYLIINIGLRFAAGLSSTFPNIFGRGTYWIILIVLLVLGFNYLRNAFVNKASTARGNVSRDTFVEIEESYYQNGSSRGQGSTNGRNQFPNGKTILLLALAALLAVPIPYSPGGPIRLIPPQQQQIQSPVSGRITEVLFNGGDGKLLKKGTVIARMVSAEIQNEILTLQEQIKEQQANLEKQQANLNKFLAGSRPEEIEVIRAQVQVAEKELEGARAQTAIAQEELQGAKVQVEIAQEELQGAKAEVEIAQEEMKGASKELEAAMVSAKYSQAEASRLEQLQSEGAFSLQSLEDARKKAETDEILIQERRQNFLAKQKNVEQERQNFRAKGKNVEQVRQIFRAKQKNVEHSRQNSLSKQKSLQEMQAKLQLILSGSLPQDIEGARQEVAGAGAELRRLKQQLQYTQNKEKSTALVMPFDGYLVESYLQTKVGSFLNQGDTFSTAQYNQNLLAELQLPEYDVSGIHVGAEAQVKLLIYPTEKLTGKVVAIEPATVEVEKSYSRIVRVLIGLKDDRKILKPGLSGYGKVNLGTKPIIVVLTRPLLRFVQVELWSWLP